MTSSPAVLSPSTPAARHRFHFLDALRGFAAFLVVFRHAPPQFAHALVSRYSYTAVDFFFCLSGFVIAFSYQQRLRGTLTLPDFVSARVIRLYPVAILGTLLGALTFLFRSGTALNQPRISSSTFAVELLLGLLVLPHIVLASLPDFVFPFDTVMWTLFVEILANLFFAVLLRAKLATSPLLSVIAAVCLAFLVRARLHAGTLDLGFTAQQLAVALARVGFSFMAGVLVFRLWKAHAAVRLHGAAALTVAGALALLFVAWLGNSHAWAHASLVEILVIAFGFPMTVFLGASLVLPPALEPACSFLGTISYPLYLLHKPLLWLLSGDGPVLFAAAHPRRATFVLLGYAAFLIVLAWLCATFLDTPVRKFLSNRYRRRFAAA